MSVTTVEISEAQFDSFYRSMRNLGALNCEGASEGGWSISLDTPNGCVTLSECTDTVPSTFTMILEKAEMADRRSSLTKPGEFNISDS